MDAGTLGLAFLAGLLSALSPCVLPLLPLVLGAAAAEHKWAPALLALGVALAFVLIGLFVATIGFSIGLDGDAFRSVAAALCVRHGWAIGQLDHELLRATLIDHGAIVDIDDDAPVPATTLT